MSEDFLRPVLGTICICLGLTIIFATNVVPRIVRRCAEEAVSPKTSQWWTEAVLLARARADKAEGKE